MVLRGGLEMVAEEDHIIREQQTITVFPDLLQ